MPRFRHTRSARSAETPRSGRGCGAKSRRRFPPFAPEDDDPGSLRPHAAAAPAPSVSLVCSCLPCAAPWRDRKYITGYRSIRGLPSGRSRSAGILATTTTTTTTTTTMMIGVSLTRVHRESLDSRIFHRSASCESSFSSCRSNRSIRGRRLRGVAATLRSEIPRVTALLIARRLRQRATFRTATRRSRVGSRARTQERDGEIDR